jgi:hypothetical protein
MSNDNCGFVALTKHRTIETQFVCPPISTDKFDWVATYKGYDEGDPIGRGPTEVDAIYDLIGFKND